jgi:hypothetical protein
MHIYIYIVSFLYIMVGALIAFLYTLRGGKFYKAIPLGWGLCILGSSFASLFFPSISNSFNDYYFRYFPEPIIMPPLVIFGWFPITIVVIIATILKVIIKYNWPQLQFWEVPPKRGKARLYLYIGLFYVFTGLVMSLLLTSNKISDRALLLYKTDHKALLAACREIVDQKSKGGLDPNKPIFEQYPQIITCLDPKRIGIDQDGFVDITMSLNLRYGVIAYPKVYKGTVGEKMYSDKSWRIELIDGLWYYDEDFKTRPEHKKEIEELLKKNKQ